MTKVDNTTTAERVVTKHPGTLAINTRLKMNYFMLRILYKKVINVDVCKNTRGQ